MLSRRTVLVVFFVVALSANIAGQGFAWAQSDPPVVSGDYVLGYLLPGESSGHLSYLEETALGTFSSHPDGTFAQQVVWLINQERRAAGLVPFKPSSELAAAANSHSVAMRDQDCFSHQCPGELSPSQRACAAGYEPYGWGACFVGETIAAGFQDPASVVAGWMGSPGHYKILMSSDLREIGVGYVSGGSYGHYWTADFGSRPDVLPVFVNYDESESNSRQVTLTLSNENVSGWGGIDSVNQVMISNDPSFAGAVWEPYSLHKSWTLAEGNGLAVVYIKFRDSTGYEIISSDAILLDAPVEYDLELSTHSLVFIYQIGSGFWVRPEGRVEVLNSSGGSSMTWSASGEVPWVGFVPGSGSTPGELIVFVGEFDTNIPGETLTSILVASPQVPDGPEEVTITVRAVDQVNRVLLPFVIKGQ